MGDVPQPSHDELVAAATWTPAAEVSMPGGSSGGEHVSATVSQILALTDPELKRKLLAFREAQRRKVLAAELPPAA